MSKPHNRKKHSGRKPMNMKEAALRVVQRLQEEGHVALWAGGCVRDRLMGLEPHDYDVATDAVPEKVIALFHYTQKVGVKFGVVLVRMGRHAIEVATFRTDLSYHDGRRPVGVEFTTPIQDAQRRDFTINGMFFDPIAETVIDHVGGQRDLAGRLIRAIGDPTERFREDHLRMLRAVRFAARFGFSIEPQTWSAIRESAKRIERISPERIRMELEAILAHPSREAAFGMLNGSGLLRHLWPGAEAIGPQAMAIEQTLAALPAEAGFELSLSVLLMALPIARVRQTCVSLRCSRSTQATVEWLIGQQNAFCDPSKLTQADLKLLMAHQSFDDLMALDAAKRRAGGMDMAPNEEIAHRVQRIPDDEMAPPPLLTGKDLIEMGLSPGPRFKMILDGVYYAQLNGEIRDRKSAIAMAQKKVSG